MKIGDYIVAMENIILAAQWYRQVSWAEAGHITRGTNYKIRTQDPCAPEAGLTGATDKKSGTGICNLWNSLCGIQGADEHLPRQPRNGGRVQESRNWAGVKWLMSQTWNRGRIQGHVGT